jgi:hypothetical protein
MSESKKMDENRIQAFIQLQLGKEYTNLTSDEKIIRLSSKFRRMVLLMIVNLGIVLFFGYSFYFEITQLSQTVYNVIIIFFLMNVFFLGLQWKKLKEAIKWLQSVD